MGLPAVKHLDPVVGVDLHSVLVAPSPTPVFLPHPHVGFMLDLREYVNAALGVIGAIAFTIIEEKAVEYLEDHPDDAKKLEDTAQAVSGELQKLAKDPTVAQALKGAKTAGDIANAVGAGVGMGSIAGRPIFVNGMLRATAGTHAFHAPALHFPLGESFAPPDPDPSNDAEAYMGSKTVLANNDPMAFLALPAMSCWAVGLEPPTHNGAHTKREHLSLPTSFMLPIPTGRPVLVGGPPIVNMAALAKGLFKAFRGSEWARALADKLHLKPGFLRCKVLGADPVDLTTGEVVMQQLDFTIAGRLPLVWDRHYSSHDRRCGTVGWGWQTPADIRVELMQHAGTVGVAAYFPDQATAFEVVPADAGWPARVYDGRNGHVLYRRSRLLVLRTRIGVEYEFTLPAHWQHGMATLAEGASFALPVDRMTDLNGNAWVFERRSDGTLARLTEWKGEEASGRVIECEAEAGGQVRGPDLLAALTLVDADGHVHRLVSYEHDDDGNLTAAIDAMNQPHRFAYADGHRMIRHTNASGMSFHYSHRWHDDESWRVEHAWGDEGLFDYHFVYDLVHRETRMTNSLGHTTILQTNERRMPVSRVDPLGRVSSYQYDVHGRTSSETNPAGGRTVWEYDARGNLLAKTLPDKSVVRVEYDSDCQPLCVTASGGRTWRYAWDERGNLRRQTTPSQASMHYEYDQHGQLVARTASDGAVTRFSYDRDGNTETVTDALGHQTLYTHDARSNVMQIISALGDRSRYEYDRNGNLTRVIEPTGREIFCTYDANGNLTRCLDANSFVTRLEYSALGRISKRLTPDGAVVEYRYDTEGQLVGVLDECGKLYRLVRDALGRIIEEIDYWGQSHRYEYGVIDELRHSTDPLGQTIDYETDALGRILKKHVLDPRRPDGIHTEKYSYDDAGNLIVAENPDMRIEFRYDAVGRIVEEKQGDCFVIANTYDGVGNRIERRSRFQGGAATIAHTVRFAYDALGAVSAIQIDDAAPMTLTRDAHGRIQVEHLDAELRHELSYTSDGRLAKQKLLNDTGALFASEYLYDANGQLIEKRDSRLGVERYQYDPVGRLTGHLDPTGKLHRFLSDPTGDRLKTRILKEKRIDVFDHEPPDDTWIREGRLDDCYYAFDMAGRLLLRRDPQQNLRLRWSNDGLLIETLVANSVNGTSSIRTCYAYDAFHRRVKKDTWVQHVPGAHLGSTSPCSTLSRTSYFFWEGDVLVAEVSTSVQETNESVSQIMSVPQPCEAKEWIYYPGTAQPLAGIRLGIAATTKHLPLDPVPVAEQTPAELHFFSTDPNGAPTRVVNNVGQVVWEMGHLSVEESTGNGIPVGFDQPLRFQGQYRDTETGLHYNRFRYFDPVMGCFITPDPIGLAGGINVFAYAPNPLNWADPLGLTPHVLQAWIERGDRVLTSHMWQVQSGGLTREQAGPWGLRSHTEPGYLELHDIRMAVQEGDTIRMVGTLDPCEPGCRPYLRDIVFRDQVTVIYDATDTNLRWTFRPARFGEFGRRRADVVVEVENLITHETTTRRHWLSNALKWTSAGC